MAAWSAFACSTQAGQMREIHASSVLLATGGLGHVYSDTTNPAVATGDGVAMAYRAGAEISDMEFVQFHPTALYLKGAPRFLLSEALRGEGAYLAQRRAEALHAEVSRTGGAGAARRGGARHRHELEAGQAARRRGLSRPDPPQCRPRAQALPDDLRHLHAVQHRHRHRAGADPPGGALRHGRGAHRSGRAHLACPDFTPPARSPAPAFTAPTAWPAIPCWKDWCMVPAPPTPCATSPTVRARLRRRSRLAPTARPANGSRRDREIHRQSAVADVAVRRRGARRQRPAAGRSPN